MKRRDKQISMKVNSSLIDEFNFIIGKFTRKIELPYKTMYSCNFPDEPHRSYDKFTLADLFEQTLETFIDKYKVSAEKSNTNDMYEKYYKRHV